MTNAPAQIPSNPQDHRTPSLTQRATSGIAWGATSAIIYQAVALVVQVALAHVLAKDQYGIYGVAVTVLTLGTLVQQVGFNEVLQHRRASLHLWVNPAAWLAGSLGLLGALIVVAAAWPVGAAYGSTTLAYVVLLMAPIPFARAMTVVPLALLAEQMRFRLLAGVILVFAIANSLLVLGLAAAGMGVFSYPVAMLTTEPLYVMSLWIASRPAVQLNPQVRRWRFMLGDLSLIFGSNAAKWVRNSADALVLGLFATKAEVGIYFFGLSMAVQIVRVVTLNLAVALLPTLNRIQGDPARQTAAFLRASGVLMLVGGPMCVGLAAISWLFTRLLLDNQKWHDLPPILATLSLGVVFRLLDEPAQSLLAAQGRFRTGFKLNLMLAAGFVVAVYMGARFGGVQGTAVAVAGYYMIAGPLQLFVAGRQGHMPVNRALRVYWSPLVLSAAAIGPWFLAERWLPGHGRPRDAAALAGMIVLSAATYVALARALRLDSWNGLLERVGQIAPARARKLLRWFQLAE